MSDAIEFLDPRPVLNVCTGILSRNSIMAAHVGSRVTCHPAPTDTDLDILVLTNTETMRRLRNLNPFKGKLESMCDDFEGGQSPFVSFRDGIKNYIATDSRDFYRRFLAATHTAQSFNLLNKSDRVLLFQAVLYGNGSRLS